MSEIVTIHIYLPLSLLLPFSLLLYTVCIITLRCTCELFPPRLTQPIHNRMTAAKVLPVIMPRARPAKHCPTSDSASFSPLSHPLGGRATIALNYGVSSGNSRGPHFYRRWRLIIARLVRQNWPVPVIPFGDNYREIPAINFAALGILSWILNRVLICARYYCAVTHQAASSLVQPRMSTITDREFSQKIE